MKTIIVIWDTKHGQHCKFERNFIFQLLTKEAVADLGGGVVGAPSPQKFQTWIL